MAAPAGGEKKVSDRYWCWQILPTSFNISMELKKKENIVMQLIVRVDIKTPTLHQEHDEYNIMNERVSITCFYCCQCLSVPIEPPIFL